MQGPTRGSEDEANDEGPTLSRSEVLQWKREVSRQLRLVHKEQGAGSRQMAGLNRALEELKIKLVGTIQRETNQVCVCVCVHPCVYMCASVYIQMYMYMYLVYVIVYVHVHVCPLHCVCVFSPAFPCGTGTKE